MQLEQLAVVESQGNDIAAVDSDSYGNADDLAVEAEITEFIQRYTDVRNSHDAAMMAEYFSESADLIGANGIVSAGRESILRNFEREHSSVYRDSAASRLIDSIRLISEDVALVSGRFQVSGTREANSDEPMVQRPGMFTLVLVREPPVSEWKITAYRSMVPTDVFRANESG